MKNFKNRSWKLHSLDKNSIQGIIEFDNGLRVSVIAGAKFYSSKIGDTLPHHSKFASFEVAVLDKDGEFITENFTDEALSRLTNLQNLGCNDTFTGGAILKLTNLQSLNCWGNRNLTDESLSNLTNLQSLDCCHAEIFTDKSLSKLINLQHRE